MDRERRGKRRFDELGDGSDGWRRDQDLRQKLDRGAGGATTAAKGAGQRIPAERGRPPRKGVAREGATPPTGPVSARARYGPGEERPERAARHGSASRVTESGGGEAKHITCYNCGKQGHVQAECKDEPFCIKCNKSGHLSAMCAVLSRAAEPFWAGFGNPGSGFVCLEVPEEELLPPAPNAARVTLSQGILSAEQLEDELKDLVDEEWCWNVQDLSNGEFATSFPSKESLRMAIRGGGLNLPNCNIRAEVSAAVGDLTAAERLEEVWVKLFDVPPPYRHPVRILLAARELGRPIGVDDQSLELASAPERDEPHSYRYSPEPRWRTTPSSWETDDDGGGDSSGVDGEAFRGHFPPAGAEQRLLSPDLGFAMAAAPGRFLWVSFFVIGFRDEALNGGAASEGAGATP
ncbi:hypothetical protein QYE76_016188 [Lolium multiflorum]|uniref:CCHC-type domain-containing protein n=1 Tax=Lolium multiflorum TaxID=4521 RepID=A0AAD8U5U0_LOLMU|nr:hypothetical protein QYE76_016188 [Lolium multiflorum]